MSDINKIVSVINSCKNEEHFHSVVNWLKHIKNIDYNTMKELIEYMSKCESLIIKSTKEL